MRTSEAVSKVSGVFQEMETCVIRDLGQIRSLFYSRRGGGIQEISRQSTVQFLDTGHFALETHVEEIAGAMRKFLEV